MRYIQPFTMQFSEFQLAVVVITAVMERHSHAYSMGIFIQHRGRVQSTRKDDDTIFHKKTNYELQITNYELRINRVYRIGSKNAESTNDG